MINRKNILIMKADASKNVPMLLSQKKNAGLFIGFSARPALGLFRFTYLSNQT